MMQVSFHPLFQLGPGICGSAQPFALCCLPEVLPADEPCRCGTGRTFADCCRVLPGEDSSDVPAGEG